LHDQSKFRLLVVRLGAMGDILHALPAVTALRRAHPCWVIDWLVEPRWRALLATDGSTGRGVTRCDMPANPAQPVIDNLLFAATKKWRKAPFSSNTIHEVKELHRSLRAGSYDVTIDLQGAIRSAFLGCLAGSRRSIGEDAPRERAARFFFTDRIITHGAHVIEQDIELVASIAGDDLHPVQPLLPIDPAAESWADGILPSGSPAAVLLNPGAGWGAKRWPIERYSEIARALADRGYRILVNAGPGEEPLSRFICDAIGSAAIPLNCPLAQLIAITRRLAMVIAGDTGPLHLACALGRPVVGIYGPTDPSRNGPYGTRFRVLRSPESRRDHTRRSDPEAGLLTIQPEAVLKAAFDLLSSESEK
jgi:heptosyltransferase-1